MHHVSAVHQLPAADGGMPDFGQMRKPDLMAAAKAIGVPIRRQCRRDNGSTYRTWRSTTDVARECQQAWHEQSERHTAPGSASAVQAQIIAGRIATETAASYQFNESHAACSASAVQPQTGLETLAPGTATSEQIQEFTAPASARAVLAQNPSETLAPHADRGNSTELGSQTPTSTSQACQLKRRSLLDYLIRKPGPAPVVAAPDVARARQQACHEQSERHIAPGAVSAVQAQATAGRIATETTSAQQAPGQVHYRCSACVAKSAGVPVSDSAPLRVLHLYALIATRDDDATPMRMKPLRLVVHAPPDTWKWGGSAPASSNLQDVEMADPTESGALFLYNKKESDALWRFSSCYRGQDRDSSSF